MEKEWGVSFGMDVKYCNPLTMRSKESIQEYVIALCKHNEIERVGDCYFSHLDNGDLVFGQVFESGFITGLSMGMQNHLHIYICSSEPFDINLLTAHTMDFFKATENATHYSIRY